MFKVKSAQEVLSIINEHFSSFKLEEETLDIKNAIGRITAENISSNEDIPGFNRSSVDGYAVISSDTFGAGESIPAQLELIGNVLMGQTPKFNIKSGQTAYIPTGGELPENADAVIMIEYTENYNDGFIYIDKPTSPGSSVIFKGDDVAAGCEVIKSNHCLRAQDIGALSAMGYCRIKVKRKIKVGIISSGDEIIEINEKPSGSKVRDVNSYSLYAGVLAFGGEPIHYGIVGDDYENLRMKVKCAIDECDVVLISGGSSVGSKDETYKVINSLGLPGILVHGIAVKPGKPTILGNLNGKAVFGLPGHPASAFMIFRIFVCYLFNVMYKTTGTFVNSLKGEMKCNYPSNNGREEYLPVKLEKIEGRLIAEPIFGKSGLITLLSAADGYIHISRGSEGLSKGEEVEVVLFS